VLVAATLAIGGCASGPPAPVIERTAAKKSPVRHKGVASDPRPEVYVVQKGDTLYGIAFDHGLDYKELADWNAVESPYVIRVGQQLKLVEPQQGVVIKPLRPASVIEAQAAQTDTRLVKTEPKATKEPYSEQAMARAAVAPAGGAKMAKVEPVQSEAQAERKDVPQERAESAATADDEEGTDWAWPAAGKVVAGFKEGSSAKGLDIAGKSGQPVYAAASGKVVYSGSGLRGYGKLVIIKHNKTYLSAYAHNSQILVKEGQSVTRGQKIAEMGNSDADQVKLHFEIRRLGKPVDPMKYLPGDRAS
jgi:lipoprotein NlpD